MAGDVTNETNSSTDENITFTNYRQILKKWKTDFKSENGRSPTKSDFNSAPDHVKQAGDMYQNKNKVKNRPFQNAAKLVNIDSVGLTLNKPRKRKNLEKSTENDTEKENSEPASTATETHVSSTSSTLLSNFSKKQKFSAFSSSKSIFK